MDEWGATDWARLGREVKRARVRAGHRDMKRWAAAVGRSTRTLQGLERGERVGDDTLMRVEAVLEWPDEHAFAILDRRVDLQPLSPDEIVAWIRESPTLTDEQKADMEAEYRRRQGGGTPPPGTGDQRRALGQ